MRSGLLKGVQQLGVLEAGFSERWFSESNITALIEDGAPPRSGPVAARHAAYALLEYVTPA